MRLSNLLSQIAELSNKSWINVAITAFISVVAIFIALPKTNLTRYEVDIDKPWPYPRLIAPFELPVKKGTEHIQQEKDSTRKAFCSLF